MAGALCSISIRAPAEGRAAVRAGSCTQRVDGATRAHVQFPVWSTARVRPC